MRCVKLLHLFTDVIASLLVSTLCMGEFGYAATHGEVQLAAFGRAAVLRDAGRISEQESNEIICHELASHWDDVPDALIAFSILALEFEGDAIESANCIRDFSEGKSAVESLRPYFAGRSTWNVARRCLERLDLNSVLLRELRSKRLVNAGELGPTSLLRLGAFSLANVRYYIWADAATYAAGGQGDWEFDYMMREHGSLDIPDGLQLYDALLRVELQRRQILLPTAAGWLDKLTRLKTDLGESRFNSLPSLIRANSPTVEDSSQSVFDLLQPLERTEGISLDGLFDAMRVSRADPLGFAFYDRPFVSLLRAIHYERLRLDQVDRRSSKAIAEIEFWLSSKILHNVDTGMLLHLTAVAAIRDEGGNEAGCKFAGEIASLLGDFFARREGTAEDSKPQFLRLSAAVLLRRRHVEFVERFSRGRGPVAD